MLSLLENLGKDAAEAKDFGITHLVDQSLYTSSVQDITLMLRAAVVFIKNEHKPAYFYETSFYWHRGASVDELPLRHFTHDKKKFSSVPPFLDTTGLQTKNNLPFNYINKYYHHASLDNNAMYNQKSWETRVDMQETRLLQHIEHRFSPVDSLCSNLEVLSENALNETPPKRTV